MILDNYRESESTGNLNLVRCDLKLKCQSLPKLAHSSHDRSVRFRTCRSFVPKTISLFPITLTAKPAASSGTGIQTIMFLLHGILEKNELGFWPTKITKTKTYPSLQNLGVTSAWWYLR